ncbi:MAG: MASE1 domain-containing protein [Opitutus sp.]
MHSPLRRELPGWARALYFGLGYFFCGEFSGYFTHWTDAVSYVWFPSGLYLGVLLLTPPRQWIALILAAAVGDLAFNYLWQPWPLWSMLLAHAGNSLSAVLGAVLIRWLVTARPTLLTVRELMGVIGLGGLLSCVVAALNGANLMRIHEPGSSYMDDFTAWYSSDLLGVILLTPAVLVWGRRTRRSPTWLRSRAALEYVALIVGVTLATGSAFYFQWLRQTETLYVAFPFIIWTALRFGPRGTTLAIVVVAVVAEGFTALGYGPLGSSSLNASEKSVEMMVSLGVFAVVGFVVATVFATLQSAQRRDAIRTTTMTLIATGAKLPAILDSIVHGVEAEYVDLRCSISLIDRSGTNLSLAAAPSLPQYFTEAIERLPIGAGMGVCGSAAFLRQRVVIADVQRHPSCAAYAGVAERAGVRACWSQPFFDSTGRLLGTFAVYYRETQAPVPADIALIATASQTAAVAVERKQLEEQFLRAQRMEGIGTLAGGMAHDLNNLFTPIVVGAELLRTSAMDTDSQRVLNNLESSARRGAMLVKQVLTFARGVEGVRETLTVSGLVASLDTIAFDAFPKNISISRELAENLPALMCDRTQIEQVLLNLCVNARDAMPGGGKITIGAKLRQVDLARAARHSGVAPGLYLEISVSDTGVGIRPEVIDRIFEPFFTTKKLGQGTGLGLSTVLGIVRSHGGFVEVSSKPDAGSTFRFHLPINASVSLVVKAESQRGHQRGNGELVLLVDDEAAIRQTTEQALVAHGYQVVSAENGAVALEIVRLRGAAIAAVITDIMMPIMNGRELVAALAKVRPNLPVVTATGLNTSENWGTSGHHLVKPYTTETLLAVIANALGRSRKIDKVGL